MQTRLIFNETNLNLDTIRKTMEKKYKKFEELQTEVQKERCNAPEMIDDYMLWQAIINSDRVQDNDDKFGSALAAADSMVITRFKEEITNHSSDFFSVLTPRRMELLEFVYKTHPRSVKDLAAELKRDYKNVYDDLLALQRFQLLEFVREGKNKRPVARLSAIEVLWDK
jgi:hypothetical protein